MANITLYDYVELERIIEDAAEKNEGEISDVDMELLVQAHTGQIEKVGGIAGYLKRLDYDAAMFKEESKKLATKAKFIENRMENIKRFIAPYLRSKGGKVTVGVHTLSLRKSEGVVLVDGFDNPLYCTTKTVTSPDKKLIKESIKSGIEVKGAVLEQREGVVVK